MKEAFTAGSCFMAPTHSINLAKRILSGAGNLSPKAKGKAAVLSTQGQIMKSTKPGFEPLKNFPRVFSSASKMSKKLSKSLIALEILKNRT